jgi:hypothetical protein
MKKQEFIYIIILLLFILLNTCNDEDEKDNTSKVAVQNDGITIKYDLKIITDYDEYDYGYTSHNPLIPGEKTEYMDIPIGKWEFYDCGAQHSTVACGKSGVRIKDCEKQLLILGGAKYYDYSDHSFNTVCE